MRNYTPDSYIFTRSRNGDLIARRAAPAPMVIKRAGGDLV